MKVIVYHSYYGCETGCCGHRIELQEDNGKVVNSDFSFFHPYSQDHLEWAKEFAEETFGKEHAADLDWENCLILDD